MKTLLKKKTKRDFVFDRAMRDQIIIDYAPTIKFIAQRIALRLPANVELDDLISAGVIGLMDAIEKYDPQRNNKFKTYAEFRIRGAMLDDLRQQDWVPRSVRDTSKKIDRLLTMLEQRFGRAVSQDELAAEMQLPIENVHEILKEADTTMVLPLDEPKDPTSPKRNSLLTSIENLSVESPLVQLLKGNLKKRLLTAIETLPEMQRLVLTLYYNEELNLKEIATIIEVTESRVSQIRSKAVITMRARLKLADTNDLHT